LRAYRNALPVGQALTILRDGSGSHFDPDLVRAFLERAPRLQLEEPRSGILARRP
jgi:putative two-component system response regulator